MAGLKLKDSIKLSTALLLMWCLFMVSVASADIDERAHWPVEVASDWNSVYGRVSNLILQDGDSVGMFDSEGNCYGAGTVREGYYFLSAYMLEEANPAIPGDFAIPGFKEGDEVIFRAYKEGTGEEYILTPDNAIPYIYTPEGKYPPIRIDLVYAGETEFPTSESEWVGGMYSDQDQDGIEWLDEEGEVALEEPEKIEEFFERPKTAKGEISPREVEKQISRTADRDGFDMDLYDRGDYYEGEELSDIMRLSSRAADGPSEHASRTDISGLSLPASKEEHGSGEIIAAGEDVITEALQAETTAQEMNPLKEDRLPLIALIASICSGFVCIVIIAYDHKLHTENRI